MSEAAARMETVQEIVENLDGMEEMEQARVLASALVTLGSTHLGSIMTEALVEMEEEVLFDDYCTEPCDSQVVVVCDTCVNLCSSTTEEAEVEYDEEDVADEADDDEYGEDTDDELEDDLEDDDGESDDDEEDFED